MTVTSRLPGLQSLPDIPASIATRGRWHRAWPSLHWRPLRQRIAVLCLGILPSCANDEEVRTVYDPCSPLTIVVPDDTTPVEVASIESAIAAWQHVLPARIVVGAGAQASDALPVRFESGDTFFRGIYWDAKGIISISRERLAPEDYPLAVAHEMGHAFGLVHVAATERPSVMNVSNLDVAPTDDDAAAVRVRWETCRDSTPVE